MRPLTDHERRTLRLGGIGVAVYLILFFGLQAWNYAERQRREYQALLAEAAIWNDRLRVYDDKVESAKKLMEQFQLDPAQLSRTTLVAQASAAIQRTAMQRGVMLGPVRETPSRAAAKELSGIQLEATGPPPALLGFLQNLGTLGFPLVLDSVQLTPGPMGPAPVKASLTLLILDFEQWKPAEGRPDA